MIPVIITALTLGFLGSFHCIGMCGAIALALPVGRLSVPMKMYSILIYNIGRAITYALMGAFFGLIGKGFVIAGYQQLLSISIGVFVLLILFIPKNILDRVNAFPKLSYILSKVKTGIAKLFSKAQLSSFFFIGILNGLLPCGLVYMGIAGAISTGDPFVGAFFMFLFGLGTMPAMTALAMIGAQVNIATRNKIRKVVPLMVAGMAVLLILRGMNLGIPYISPQLHSDKIECDHACCHKQ